MSEAMVIDCPFCEKKVIRILYREGIYNAKRIMVGSNRNTVPVLTHSKDEILVDKCPNCGKTKKEIESALKHGKELSTDEIVKRLREAGLDPSKLK
jgi:endogenous inhibitor of DNA gyrase (YacG/DUF329 family)